MSDRITSLSPQAFSPSTAPTDTPQATGEWRGETVLAEAPDTATLLDNAKEEIGVLLSEKLESKGIEEREIEDVKPVLRIDQPEATEAYIEQMPDMELDKLLNLVKEWQTHDQGADSMLQQARDSFEEPAHAFAALDIAAKGATGDRKLALEAARDKLMAIDGPAVRAGLNVSRAAHEAASGDPAATQRFRDGYREALASAPGPAGLLRTMLDRLGPSQFTAAFGEDLRFMTRALADDLAEIGGLHGPSAEPARLQQVITDLSTVRVMETAHERCTLMADRLGRMGIARPEPTAVLRVLLPLTEGSGAGPGRFVPLPGQAGVPANRLDAGIAFLRETREVLASMPVGIFADMETRLSALRGAQEAMDMAIENEEAQ